MLQFRRLSSARSRIVPHLSGLCASPPISSMLRFIEISECTSSVLTDAELKQCIYANKKEMTAIAQYPFIGYLFTRLGLAVHSLGPVTASFIALSYTSMEAVLERLPWLLDHRKVEPAQQSGDHMLLLSIRSEKPSMWESSVSSWQSMHVDSAPDAVVALFRLRDPLYAALANPAFDNAGTFDAAHRSLCQMLRWFYSGCERHKCISPTSQAEGARSLPGHAFFRKLKSIYLRSRKLVEFSEALIQCTRAERRHAEATSTAGPLLGDDILSFAVAAPGRRECVVSPELQWALCRKMFSEALPFLVSLRSALSNTLNIAIFGTTAPDEAARFKQLLQTAVNTAAKTKGRKYTFAVDAVFVRELIALTVEISINKMKVVRFHPLKCKSLLLLLHQCEVLLAATISMEHGKSVSSAVTSFISNSWTPTLNSPRSVRQVKECCAFAEDVLVRLLESVVPIILHPKYLENTMRQMLIWGDEAMAIACGPMALRSYNMLSVYRIVLSTGPLAESLLQIPLAAQFEWKCGCGALNSGAQPFCLACSIDSIARRDLLSTAFRCPVCQELSVGGMCDKCLVCGTQSPHEALLRSRGMWCCRPCGVSLPLGRSCALCGSLDPQSAVQCAECKQCHVVSASFCPSCGHIPPSKKSLRIWRCAACGEMNEHSVVCRACLKKGVRTARDLARSPSMSFTRWKCGCGSLNPPTCLSCRSCNESSNGKALFFCSECKQLQSMTVGESVGALNRAARCSGCASLHPREVALLASRLALCPDCRSFVATDENSCTRCGSRGIWDLTSPHPTIPDLPWTCHRCGKGNALPSLGQSTDDAFCCSQCGADRVDVTTFTEYSHWCCTSSICAQSPTPNRGFACSRCFALHPAISPRDVFVWICPNTTCGEVHASWCGKCRKCGSDNPLAELLQRGQPHLADIMVGDEVQGALNQCLLRYEPWKCSKCASHNAATSIQACNFCGAPAALSRPCDLCGTIHSGSTCHCGGTNNHRLRDIDKTLLLAFARTNFEAENGTACVGRNDRLSEELILRTPPLLHFSPVS